MSTLTSRFLNALFPKTALQENKEEVAAQAHPRLEATKDRTSLGQLDLLGSFKEAHRKAEHRKAFVMRSPISDQREPKPIGKFEVSVNWQDIHQAELLPIKKFEGPAKLVLFGRASRPKFGRATIVDIQRRPAAPVPPVESTSSQPTPKTFFASQTPQGAATENAQSHHDKAQRNRKLNPRDNRVQAKKLDSGWQTADEILGTRN